MIVHHVDDFVNHETETGRSVAAAVRVRRMRHRAVVIYFRQLLGRGILSLHRLIIVRDALTFIVAGVSCRYETDLLLRFPLRLQLLLAVPAPCVGTLNPGLVAPGLPVRLDGRPGVLKHAFRDYVRHFLLVPHCAKCNQWSDMLGRGGLTYSSRWCLSVSGSATTGSCLHLSKRHAASKQRS